MSGRKIMNGFMVVTVGQTGAYALSFVRNIILARVLSRADFGLAAIFAVTITMLELSSRMAIGQQVVQAQDGDSEIFLNTAHLFQSMAGLVSMAAILLLSVPMAYFFKVPDKTWAFTLLALVPICRGLNHLDIQRRQRKFEFRPCVCVELIPQFIATALAWPLAVWIGDYRVVLILLLGKELLNTIFSHALAQQSYKWNWDKALARGMWIFGWPLIINGLLIFASQQGDQMLVGGGYSLEVLALYAAAGSLISAPFMIIAQGSSSIMLPVLARAQGSMEQFNGVYEMCTHLSAVGAAVVMIPLIITGEQALTILFGAKYSGGGSLLALLAVACAFRVLRIAPATAAMARADTQNQMLSNLLRNCSLLLGIGAVLLGATVETVAACAILGELLALVASIGRLAHRQAVLPWVTLGPALYLIVCLGVAGGIMYFGAQQWGIHVNLCASGLLVVCAIIAARWLFPESMGRCWNEIGFAVARWSASPKANPTS